MDVLNGSFTLNQAVVHDHGSGLDILTTKEGGADTPDLLNSQNMKSLLEELGRSYEMVVIDAPPVLPVGDTKLLSRLVDAVYSLCVGKTRLVMHQPKRCNHLLMSVQTLSAQR